MADDSVTHIGRLFEALNPAIKLSWMEEHWSARDAAQAREWVLDAVSATPRIRSVKY